MTIIKTKTEKLKPLLKSQYEYELIKEWTLDLHNKPNYDTDVITFWVNQLTEWENNHPLVD